MATIEITFPSDGPPGKILKWRVRSDTMVSMGRVLLLYQSATPNTENGNETEKKLRAMKFGRIKQLLVKEGDIVQPGQVIALLEGCKHPAMMIDLCAECGADLRVEGVGNGGGAAQISQASVPMVHSIPELKVCPELAEKIGKKDEERLLKDRKLVLLVDLDQTIVHTTNDEVSPNLKDVYHFQLYGPGSLWYHTRLRPNTRHFLSKMTRLYELHICTFGARNYAHTVVSLLDKDGTLFSQRILSRDECFDPASKTANLKALFPCGDDLVCIIDDREDVWQGCGNLVQVKPYHFFRNTSNITAPPELKKGEILNLPDLVDINESRVSDSQNNDNKIDATDSLNQVSTPYSNPPEVEEIETDESYNESNKTKNTDTKADSEENIDSNVQCSTVNENNKMNEEIINILSPMEIEKDIKKEETEQNIIDEDDDDYLLYLEDILRRIHTEFYSELEKGNNRKSIRDIISLVRSQVLKGLCLTFSGLIPTHQKLHQSRAYKVARAFGAEVTQDLTERTTHLVAIRKGTAKANAARKNPNIKIVNPEWLWTCTERWEHVDERLYPLTSQARGSRIPPPHCSSPEHVDEIECKDTEVTFANSINPLMSFTPEEIEFMDKEVEEDMEDEDTPEDILVFEEESASPSEEYKRIRRRNYDSEDSTNGNIKCVSERKKKKLSNNTDEVTTEGKANDSDTDNDNNDDDNDNTDNDDTDNDDEDEDDDDNPQTDSTKTRDLSEDLDLEDNSNDSVDLEAEDNEDDQEWRAMGAALEREILSE